MSRYRYVVSKDRTFGTKLPDGSWTGMMGMVVREVRKTKGFVFEPLSFRMMATLHVNHLHATFLNISRLIVSIAS